MERSKFEFNLEFQFEILRLTVLDINGYKALELYDEKYFTQLEHSIIAFALKRYYKKRRRVPSKPLLIEELKDVFKSREYADIPDDDKKSTMDLLGALYSGQVKDPDYILIKLDKFIQYLDLREVFDSVDLKDSSSYETLVSKTQKAVTSRLKKSQDTGTFLFRDIKVRQFDRQDKKPIVPLPFQQLNKLTNANGVIKGSIMVILDKPKKFKTGALINITKAYLKRKKNVLYVDLENGEDEISIRTEQSITNHNKREILSGEFDAKVQKTFRKYKRLGAEGVIKRFPTYTTTTHDIKAYMNRLYIDHGIKFQVIVIDYAALLGSTTKKMEDNDRISDVYLDLKNLALEEDIEHIWTAMHVKRTDLVEKRSHLRYHGEDIAKCMDIVRHVNAIYGLNQTDEEEENGFLRMEIVEQRDGKSKGRAVFMVNKEVQSMIELTTSQRATYEEEIGQEIDAEIDKYSSTQLKSSYSSKSSSTQPKKVSDL